MVDLRGDTIGGEMYDVVEELKKCVICCIEPGAVPDSGHASYCRGCWLEIEADCNDDYYAFWPIPMKDLGGTQMNDEEEIKEVYTKCVICCKAPFSDAGVLTWHFDCETTPLDDRDRLAKVLPIPFEDLGLT